MSQASHQQAATPHNSHSQSTIHARKQWFPIPLLHHDNHQNMPGGQQRDVKEAKIQSVPPVLFSNLTLQQVLEHESLQIPTKKELQPPFWRSYMAALGITGRIIPLPIVVAFITALLYIAPASGIPVIGSPDNIGVLVDGLLITAVAWGFISLFCTGFTTFDGANVQSSTHLKRHLLTLKSVLLLIKEKTNPDGKTYATDNSLAVFRSKSPDSYDLALQCMYENVCGAIYQLKTSDPQAWIQGNGYLKIWNFILLAEETMLDVAPREFVIREALHDEAAINGSDIALHDTILSNIKTAVKQLSPSAGRYLKSLPAQDRTAPSDKPPANQSVDIVVNNKPSIMFTVSENVLKRFFPRPGSNHHASNIGNGNKEPDVISEIEARNALRDARQTLNDFRATQWDGLVRLRNQIYGTSIFTATLTYALLCAAIFGGIDRTPLKAAIFFYLVGATIGLFSRLFTERQSDSAIDDYGLTIARVTVTPIVSGVAAIAGVLVVAFLSLNLLNTPGSQSPPGGLPSLSIIYDLVQDRQGIIIAALFGFAPNLFINVLQQKANDATTKLKNSTAPGSGN